MPYSFLRVRKLLEKKIDLKSRTLFLTKEEVIY